MHGKETCICIYRRIERVEAVEMYFLSLRCKEKNGSSEKWEFQNGVWNIEMVESETRVLK